ncbi:MAG: hypothetical protein P1P77_01855 [Spirochaetaceae bacterium]|nr:hypothetical protein [Spirochaetaceae bacterium]
MRRTSLVLAESFGRSALRRPVFTVLLLLPAAMGLLLRPLPAGLALAAPGFDPTPWMPLFLGVVAGFPPYLFGLLTGLMLLDERDRHLHPALRATPISDRGLLAAKAAPAALMAMIGTPITLILSGKMAEIPFGAVIASGLIAAPYTVFNALIAASLARNKVQGMTVSKILGTLLAAPAAFLLAAEPWRYSFLVFPATWISAAFNYPEDWVFWSAGGFIYAGTLALFAGKTAMHRYFSLY